MQYMFRHDFHETILLLKGKNVWIITSRKNYKLLEPAVKFIQDKKDEFPILQLHLVTISKKNINFEEELFLKVLKEANISNDDIIGMLTNDQQYNSSKIIRKWNKLFTNKVDIKEIISRGLPFSDIRWNSNISKIQEEMDRNIMCYL